MAITFAEYNRYIDVFSECADCFRKTVEGKLPLNEYIEMKKERVFSQLAYEKLTEYHRGMIEGVNIAYFDCIQNFFVEWKLYYTPKPKFFTVKKQKEVFSTWDKLPAYIKESRKYKGNLFWKDSDRPWSSLPVVGTNIQN